MQPSKIIVTFGVIGIERQGRAVIGDGFVVLTSPRQDVAAIEVCRDIGRIEP